MELRRHYLNEMTNSIIEWAQPEYGLIVADARARCYAADRIALINDIREKRKTCQKYRIANQLLDVMLWSRVLLP